MLDGCLHVLRLGTCCTAYYLSAGAQLYSACIFSVVVSWCHQLAVAFGGFRWAAAWSWHCEAVDTFRTLCMWALRLPVCVTGPAMAPVDTSFEFFNAAMVDRSHVPSTFEALPPSLGLLSQPLPIVPHIYNQLSLSGDRHLRHSLQYQIQLRERCQPDSASWSVALYTTCTTLIT